MTESTAPESFTQGPTDVELLEQTLAQNLDDTARRFADRAALLECGPDGDPATGRTWTYGQLREESVTVAKALMAAGYEAGDRIDFSGEKILMKASSEERVKAVKDVFESKLVKRGISLKSLDAGAPFASGKEYRIAATMKEGIDQPTAKKITKLIRDEGPKSVKAQIQGDELRVSSKSRDDLQSVIAMLKDFEDADLQFVNFR